MKIRSSEESWTIELTSREEAAALLEVQASPVGNEVMSTTDMNHDRVEPARKAVDLLRFAEIVLPRAGVTNGSETVSFPLKETQHIVGLMYGAVKLIDEMGEPATAHDELLIDMNAQVDSFFGAND